MKLKPWKTKNSRYIIRNRWIKVRADKCTTDEGVVIAPYYVLEYPNWVHMVVIDEKNRVLITKQYRHGAGKVGFEIPCGTMDQTDKTPLRAAKRELREETGYGGKFVLVGKTSPNPANHANTIYVFLVTQPRKRTNPKSDKKERIEFKFLKVKKVMKLIDQGKFNQALHISSLVLGLRKSK